jgi:hypothetical protein
MKKRVSLPLLIFLSLFASSVYGECLPVACYVEKVRVLSCRSVSEVVIDGQRLQNLGIQQRQAQGILDNSSAIVLQGQVYRSRSVTLCADPDKQRFADGSMVREYLVTDASCADYPINFSTEGFVTTACCDTLPVDSVECVLPMEVMSSQPDGIQ